MNHCDWIICELADRWTAALRVTVARDPDWAAPQPRLYVVRSLEELAARLEVRPHSLGLIEVQHTNLPRVLTWLAHARECFPKARFAALLDHDDCARDVTDALLEAGAADFASSPRRLQHILSFARRHAHAAAAAGERTPGSRAFTVSVWSTLPWQVEERQVG